MNQSTHEFERAPTLECVYCLAGEDCAERTVFEFQTREMKIIGLLRIGNFTSKIFLEDSSGLCAWTYLVIIFRGGGFIFKIKLFILNKIITYNLLF